MHSDAVEGTIITLLGAGLFASPLIAIRWPLEMASLLLQHTSLEVEGADPTAKSPLHAV